MTHGGDANQGGNPEGGYFGISSVDLTYPTQDPAAVIHKANEVVRTIQALWEEGILPTSSSHRARADVLMRVPTVKIAVRDFFMEVAHFLHAGGPPYMVNLLLSQMRPESLDAAHAAFSPLTYSTQELTDMARLVLGPSQLLAEEIGLTEVMEFLHHRRTSGEAELNREFAITRERARLRRLHEALIQESYTQEDLRGISRLGRHCLFMLVGMNEASQVVDSTLDFMGAHYGMDFREDVSARREMVDPLFSLAFDSAGTVVMRAHDDFQELVGLLLGSQEGFQGFSLN